MRVRRKCRDATKIDKIHQLVKQATSVPSTTLQKSERSGTDGCCCAFTVAAGVGRKAGQLPFLCDSTTDSCRATRLTTGVVLDLGRRVRDRKRDSARPNHLQKRRRADPNLACLISLDLRHPARRRGNV